MNVSSLLLIRAIVFTQELKRKDVKEELTQILRALQNFEITAGFSKLDGTKDAT